MAGFSTYFAQQFIVEKFVNNPTGLYLALFKADPTDAFLAANEVNYGGTEPWYVRKQIGAWTNPTGSTVSTSNISAITFNAVTGSACAITHWGVVDASSGGHLLVSNAVDGGTRTLNVNDVWETIANALLVTMD